MAINYTVKRVQPTLGHRSSGLNGCIRKITMVGDKLAILRVAFLKGELPTFIPGQHVTIGLPRMRDEQRKVDKDLSKSATVILRRAYSICSTPEETDSYEILLNLAQNGDVAPSLWLLNVGERIWIESGVKGRFTLERANNGSELLFMATGAGIAPFISMIRSTFNSKPWKKLALIYGTRGSEDLAYHQELLEYSSKDKDFFYEPILSREPFHTDWDGGRGWIQEVLKRSDFRKISGLSLDPKNTHVFLCGNSDMINSVKELVYPLGFTDHTSEEPGNIHAEAYY